MKYYVVADVHSYYQELETALKEKGFFEDTKPHKLIVCGDLFDRGRESVQVQDFICDLMSKKQVILIKGNHEDMLEELIRNGKRWFNFPDIAYTHHWHNKAVQTVLDLAGNTLFDLGNPDKIVADIKKTPAFSKIIPKMRNFYETEHYIFVHGWIPCRRVANVKDKPSFVRYRDDWRDASDESWEYARGDNGMYQWNEGVREPNKTIVCGHWHASWGHYYIDGKGSEVGNDADFSPFIAKGIIALDACTALSRKVNCVVLED